ncbi:CrcB protein [Amycolatopsis arida]|uniref:Fluoride-specific ion channel FluC n=1 Tax=Amycolatopsis arida TaxID=587909 RepID=A0A1I5M1S3_9PSEU|nr:CrcB family protein [Amycolatopsis arida]TDX93916.1 CrcB protein [Amycolatopsis arida]SFP02936.1 CrcB protein [Amycolatopsis arida]
MDFRSTPGRPVEHRAAAVPARRVDPVVLLAIAAGGVLGALARFGVDALLPHRPGTWAWATLLVNVSGCLLIGVLMVLVEEVWPGRRLPRPFLGIGLLGGYTTFSTAMVDAQQLARAGAAHTAVLYLGGTLLVALTAVAAGAAGTTALLGWRRTRGPHT